LLSTSGTAAARQAPTHFDWNRISRLLAPLLLGWVIWFLPPPEGLQPKALQVFAIFVATIVGIMVAPLEMPAVAIIGATAAALLGVIPCSAVVDSTGTDLVWLVILAFFISRGVIKTGLGRRVALMFMRFLGRTTVGLGYGLALTELAIAPAMPSITARAGRVILPIAKAVSEVLGSHPEEATRRRGRKD
jgi:DASS family divalent anion:Na+ symporter